MFTKIAWLFFISISILAILQACQAAVQPIVHSRQCTKMHLIKVENICNMVFINITVYQFIYANTYIIGIANSIVICCKKPQAGDTCEGTAQRYGVALESIYSINHWSPEKCQKLAVGDFICVA
jgi:hypothetical protein